MKRSTAGDTRTIWFFQTAVVVIVVVVDVDDVVDFVFVVHDGCVIIVFLYFEQERSASTVDHPTPQVLPSGRFVSQLHIFMYEEIG
jgi:hypothetical protein